MPLYEISRGKDRRLSKEITSFIASPPPTGNMLTLDGHGGAKVTFAIPESEIANATKLVLCIGKTFRVKVEAEPNQKEEY